MLFFAANPANCALCMMRADGKPCGGTSYGNAGLQAGELTRLSFHYSFLSYGFMLSDLNNALSSRDSWRRKMPNYPVATLKAGSSLTSLRLRSSSCFRVSVLPALPRFRRAKVANYFRLSLEYAGLVKFLFSNYLSQSSPEGCCICTNKLSAGN